MAGIKESVTNEKLVGRKIAIQWRGKTVHVAVGKLSYGMSYLAADKSVLEPIIDAVGKRIMRFEEKKKPSAILGQLWIITYALQAGDYDKNQFPPTFENVFFLDASEGNKIFEHYNNCFKIQKEVLDPKE